MFKEQVFGMDTVINNTLMMPFFKVFLNCQTFKSH